jgi:hypothetical protein
MSGCVDQDHDMALRGWPGPPARQAFRVTSQEKPGIIIYG